MKKGLFITLIFALSACERVEPIPPSISINNTKFEVNGDVITLHEFDWKLANLGDYPFTTAGDIGCNNGSVEFYPNGLHEQDIGLPLNQTAKDNYKKANLTPNVPNSIKPNADLSQAIRLGLMICDYNRTHSPV